MGTLVDLQVAEGTKQQQHQEGVGSMWVGCNEAAALEWQEVVGLLTSDVTRGLAETDVQARRATVGYNQFTEAEDEPLWKKYLGQVSGSSLNKTHVTTFQLSIG